jgi:hypothetical protein
MPEEEAPRPVEGDDEPEASEEAAAAEKADAEPAPRRKRKKKRPAPASDTATDDDATGEEPAERREVIPAFALDFPVDPALQALVAAFEHGDYARVRREAPALVKSTDSAAVRKAARTLLKRIEPDPIAVYLLAGAALLLSFLAFWYWTHPHAAP